MPLPGGIQVDPIVVHQFLSTVGDGTGDTNAIGDYSLAEEIFFIQPAIGEVIIVHELLLHVIDGGSFAADNYGALATLGVGIDVRITNSRSAGLSMLPGLITENSDFMHCGLGAFNLVDFAGPVGSIIASFKPENFGTTIILDGSQEHKIEVILNDDFTGLIDHHFIAHGFK